MLHVGVIAKIEGIADRAAGLAQHLKAFAVERSGGWNRVRQREERYFLERNWRGAPVSELGAAVRAVPSARELDRGRSSLTGRGRDSPWRARECSCIEAARLLRAGEARAKDPGGRAGRELQQLASRRNAGHLMICPPSNSTTTVVAVGFKIGRSRCRSARPFSNVIFTSAPPSR